MSYLGDTAITNQGAAEIIRTAGGSGPSSSGSSLPIRVIAIGGIAAVAAYFIFIRKRK